MISESARRKGQQAVSFTVVIATASELFGVMEGPRVHQSRSRRAALALCDVERCRRALVCCGGKQTDRHGGWKSRNL
jgi:hypothetical protein